MYDLSFICVFMSKSVSSTMLSSFWFNWHYWFQTSEIRHHLFRIIQSDLVQ